MRIAIVSDIHGNATALEAVLADLRHTSPDLVLHGGDLADGGANPARVVDRIRDLGWRGVVGNTDEMLFRPDSLRAFATRAPGLARLFHCLEEMAAATRERLGEERLAWLRALPPVHLASQLALVHGSPQSPWEAPAPDADEAELRTVFAPLARPLAVYAHLHRPFVRRLAALTVANTGSVGLPYDGDPRASYLLIDGASPGIRRVDYDRDRERQDLLRSGLPHADWMARLLASAAFEMP